jgi:hydrogenase-4 component B
MLLILLAVGLLLAGGCAALLSHSSPRAATGCAVGGAVAAAVLGLVPSVRVLCGAPAPSLHRPWDVPYGTLFVQVDALSAFFLVVILVLSALAAIYGAEYLRPYRETRSLGPPWFFFNLLVASMVLVVIARNAVLFLVAWEVMALASFFLVTFEDEKESVRDAGWVYLVATHLGTAFLLVLFILLGSTARSLDFDQFSVAPSQAGLLFVLAVIGFGAKAGFMPLHVWLPEAHPAAPSHVSAVMSGVMIKTGIYGLVRTLTFLTTSAAPPPEWWGWLLCAVGVTSGIFGVLFALAQHDLKRLLAYHSVENIGIIALGLGVGILGLSAGMPTLAALGFAGGLLHVLNHALFKGLLFLGTGAVAHATGTREIDDLGGLLKRMPWTAFTFLIGAVAISGLPPLNGFVSELLIYLGAFHGVTSASSATTVPGLCVIAGLALIGGLAAACFAKAFGIVFLGEPRSDHAARAHEPGLAMRLPMLLLAASCVLIGLLAPLAMYGLAPVVANVTGLSPDIVRVSVTRAGGVLSFVTGVGVGLLALIAALAALRYWLLSGRPVTAQLTWDCGYGHPTPRMQYTASSFAQPLTDLFSVVLHTRRRLVPPTGWFPQAASLATETEDVCAERVYAPVFAGIGRGLASLRWVQHGRVHLYVLYIALTLVVLLVWKLG